MTTRRKRMCLFAWTDIFRDYYPGLAVVIAPDRTAAEAALAEAYGQHAGSSAEYMRLAARKHIKQAGEPEVIDLGLQPPEVKAWFSTGGG